MKDPNQISPQGLADYLEVLTRAVFQAGMNWRVIEAKWPGFVEASHRFDPDTVAALGVADTGQDCGRRPMNENLKPVPDLVSRQTVAHQIPPG
jgi:hypothetical protein